MKTLIQSVMTVSMGLLLHNSFASADTRHVSVTGQCQRLATPDRAAVAVVAQARSTDLKSAERKATDIYERMKAAVKKLGLDKEVLQTTEYNLGEVREWENNRSVSKGFQARIGLRVETSDLKRIGEVVTIASKEGVTDIGSLQLFLSNEKETREHAACLKAAATNAREKAEEVSQGLNAKVGKVISIEEQAGQSSPPMPMFKASSESMALRDGGPATIEGGQQTINVGVRVAFELL